MPCSQVNLNPVTLPSTPVLTSWSGFTQISGRRLYICDNPEPLKNATFSTPIVTLWDDVVPTTTSVNYRVFMWHHNDSSSTVKYGVTVGNAGANPVTVSGIKYETTITPNSGDILTNAGLCLAKALLGQTMIVGGSSISVPTGKVQTIQEFTLAAGQVRGLVMEFTLSSTSTMTAKVRTVAAKNTSAVLNTHQGTVIASDGTHPRGTWNYAEVQGTSGTITFGNASAFTGLSVLGTPSIYPGTLPNSAGYGSVYNIDLKISNTSTRSQTANLYLNPRGGLFVGAVKVGSNPVNGVSKTTTAQAVKIGGFTVGAGQAITVPIKISTGGGSSTPVALLVQNI